MGPICLGLLVPQVHYLNKWYSPLAMIYIIKLLCNHWAPKFISQTNLNSYVKLETNSFIKKKVISWFELYEFWVFTTTKWNQEFQQAMHWCFLSLSTMLVFLQLFLSTTSKFSFDSELIYYVFDVVVDVDRK